MKNNIYVLNQRQDETFDAAGKAMRDVFSVLADKKAKIIWSVPKHCSKYLKLLDLPYLVLFLLFCVKKSDSVFYSIPENHLKIRLLKRLQLLKKYRIICFINDLNAFRYDGQNDGDPGEVRALAAADKILAPNVNTVSMLKKNGISSDMIPVGIWDYRMNETQIAKIREISHAHKKENAVKLHLQGISTNQNFCLPWRSLPMSGWNYGENSIRSVKRHWQKDAIIMESSLPMRYRLQSVKWTMD